jgi:hypothetical protein
MQIQKKLLGRKNKAQSCSNLSQVSKLVPTLPVIGFHYNYVCRRLEVRYLSGVVNLYQDCLNYSIVPTLGVIDFHYVHIVKPSCLIVPLRISIISDL